MTDKNETKIEGNAVTTENREKPQTFINGQLCGLINIRIGTGDNAKASIVYTVLQYVFGIGILLSILVVFNYWCFRQQEKVPDFVGDLKAVWQLFLPIVTLVLGYLFGNYKSTK